MPATTTTLIRKARDEAEERQGHQVEADVQVELRVVLPERFLVQEEQHFLPLAGGGASGEQAEEYRQADHDHPADRFELRLVAVQVVPDLRIRGVDRTGVVGDPDGIEHRSEHEREGDQEDDDACQVLREEDFKEPKLLVPENIGPNIGEEDESDHNQCYDDQRRRQGTSPWLGSSGRSGAGGTGQTRYLIAGRQLLVLSKLRVRDARTAVTPRTWGERQSLVPRVAVVLSSCN